ncbi:hypothetical protein BV898_17487 [Hypsibius exemplaris]|uniref:PHD-type domain-containing protein n=1 Tax=Hypsibius exemplaris TaxID=2072580 RepID=A0A9X6NMD0_HYPEX|nr:hypothetical protein BV898_17487 [Hypsibius exemplaris]
MAAFALDTQRQAQLLTLHEVDLDTAWEFCKMALNLLRGGPHVRMIERTAKKLDWPPEKLQTTLEAISALLKEAVKAEVQPDDLRASLTLAGLQSDQAEMLAATLGESRREVRSLIRGATSETTRLQATDSSFGVEKKKSRHCLECVDQQGPQLARLGVLLECTSCNYATHPNCGGYSAETVDAVDGNYKCMQCKRCKICNTGILGDDPDLVVCVRCDNSFHLTCHTPPVTLEQASKEWRCADCKSTKKITAVPKKALHAMRRERKNAALKAKRLLQKAIPFKETKEKPRIPDNVTWHHLGPTNPLDKNLFGSMTKRDLVIRAVDSFYEGLPPKKTPELVQQIVSWTVEEVAAKFEAKALHDFAACIKQQCIDGAALMLLTRDDVITRFGLPMVPALKLYREICILCPFGPFTDWN